MSEQQLPAAPPQHSPDGRWWWDGSQWLPVTAAPRPRRSVLVAGMIIGAVGLAVLGLLALLSTMRIGTTVHGDEEFDREYCQVFPEDC